MSELKPDINYVSAIYKLLPTIGVFNPDEPNDGHHPAIRTLQKGAYIVVVNMSLLQFIVGCTVILHLEGHTFTEEELFFEVSQLMVHSIVIVLLVYMQCRPTACYRLLDRINAHFHMRSARGGPRYVSMINLVTFLKSGTYYYILICLGINQMLVVLPALIQRRLLFPCWYPFAVDDTPVFQLILMYQIFGQGMMPYAFTVVTLYTLSAALIICAQFDILFGSIECIEFLGPVPAVNGTKHPAWAQPVSIAHDSKNKFKFATEFVEIIDRTDHHHQPFPSAKRANSALHDCVAHHQKIVECAKDLEEIASPILLFKYFMASGAICMDLYNILEGNASLKNKVVNTVYLFYTACDVFLLAHMGQIVLSQSIRVRDFVFALPWYRFDKEFQMDLQFMQLYSQREIQLTGGKFFVMNYDKFIAIVKMGFSLYTMLVQE